MPGSWAGRTPAPRGENGEGADSKRPRRLQRDRSRLPPRDRHRRRSAIREWEPPVTRTAATHTSRARDAGLAPTMGAHLRFASSEASRACGPSVAATAEAKSPGFVHARARSRGRHRRASRTCIQRLRVSRPKSQETRLSPPAGRPTPSAGTSSSRSARTPCFASNAGTRTRRRRPVQGPAFISREVSGPNSAALVLAKLGHLCVVNCAASGLIGARACFAEVAGVAEVLAGGRIRGVLQAHTAPTHGLPMLPMPRSIRT